jgi:hypothetical protein
VSTPGARHDRLLPWIAAERAFRAIVLLVRPCHDNDTMRLWHKHIWSEWERAWGKGSPKDYVLERKCTVCGKTQTQVIR